MVLEDIMEPIIRMTPEQEKVFSERLTAEQQKLEAELATVGHPNPDAPGDWVANPDTMDIMEADRNEAADRLEDLEDNAAILDNLEVRLNRVKRALEKIELGTYGTCEVGGEQITMDRLEANPAALTCVEHASKLHN